MKNIKIIVQEEANILAKKTFEIRIGIFCEEYLRAEKQHQAAIRKEIDKLEYLHELNNLEKIDKDELLNSESSKKRIEDVASTLAHRALEENNIYYDSRLCKRYDELLNNSVERNNAFLLQHQSKFKKFSEFFVQEHQRLQFELQNN